MAAPFLVFPWTAPFLPMLKRKMDTHEGGVPLIISPTARPWQYLKALYLADGNPRLLPRILTLKDVEAMWFAELSPVATREANTLDAVALLREATRQATKDADENGAPLSFETMDMAQFFPWGVRLADLIDEMLSQLVLPEDIAGTEGEVMPHATVLLDRLGEIRASYLDALTAHGLTTRGLMGFSVASHLTANPDCEIPAAFRPTQTSPVYIVGFHTLTRAQEAILRRLWEAGAHICLHTDPLVAGDDGTGRPVHWICQRHADWVTSWGARTELIAEEDGEASAGPDISLRAGYDLHSQLSELREDLLARDRSATAAIVLPSPTLLMPVLHNLPDKDHESVNVTIGCPLSEAPVHQLILDILALHEHAGEHGRFHWRRLLACFENPVLTGLGVPRDGEAVADGVVYRAVRLYSRLLREGLRFIHPEMDVLNRAAFTDMDEEKAVIRDMLACFIEGFQGVTTTADLARALSRLCDFMRQRMPRQMRERSPMDMEALFRMENTIVPQLADNLLAHEAMDLKTLSAIVDGMFHRAALYFDPSEEQLTVLQVTGIIESTLLHYDHVYVIEATDDRIPGKKRRDPLLPDSLRAVIGLPDLNQGDQELGYAIHRLCANASRVRFYWQEGVVRTHLFDGKKTRSRFVEEFIWRHELASGHLITPDAPDSPLRIISCQLAPLSPRERTLTLASGTAARDAIEQALRGPVSPSFLDDYISCPAKFALKRLAQLRELEEVNEEDDPSGVGIFIHAVLEAFHREWLGQAMPAPAYRKPLRERLMEIFEEKITSESCLLKDTLPPDSLATLVASARRHLPAYLENQPEGTVPLLLEQNITSDVAALGRSFRLSGFFDRLDRRDGGLVLLDYKTGSISGKGVSLKLWDNDSFFERLEAVTWEDRVDLSTWRELDGLMATLRAGAGSIQLPAYITIASAPGGPAMDSRGTRGATGDVSWPDGDVLDAAFVELANEGLEVSLYKPGRKPAKMSPADFQASAAEARAHALSRCPDLVRLVLMHLVSNVEFGQLRGDHCRYCDFAQLCQS